KGAACQLAKCHTALFRPFRQPLCRQANNRTRAVTHNSGPRRHSSFTSLASPPNSSARPKEQPGNFTLASSSRGIPSQIVSVAQLFHFGNRLVKRVNYDRA